MQVPQCLEPEFLLMRRFEPLKNDEIRLAVTRGGSCELNLMKSSFYISILLCPRSNIDYKVSSFGLFLCNVSL